MALMTAVTFFLLHSVFDFPMRIPANGLLFFALIGAITVLVREGTSRHDGTVPVAKQAGRSIRYWLLYAAKAVSLVVAGAVIVLAVRDCTVRYMVLRAERKFISQDLAGVERDFALARRLNAEDPELVRAYGEYLKSRAFSPGMNEKSYYEKVITVYKEALERNPYLPENYLRLAWVLAQAKQFDEAEEFLNEAVDANPFFLLSHIQRAHFYLFKNDLDKAAEEYAHVLDALMAMPYSPYSKANILLDQMSRQAQAYPLHPALRGMYKRLVAYREQVAVAG